MRPLVLAGKWTPCTGCSQTYRGDPVAMPWRDKVRAIVEAWYPGQASGQAIAEILTGTVNPSGRLPMTFPATLDQTPRPELPGLGTPWGTATTIRDAEGAEVGNRWFAKTGEQPLYAFGHGLSCISFDYSDLTVEGGDTVTATFTVISHPTCHSQSRRRIAAGRTSGAVLKSASRAAP